jgi:hypothetical protein
LPPVRRFRSDRARPDAAPSATEHRHGVNRARSGYRARLRWRLEPSGRVKMALVSRRRAIKCPDGRGTSGGRQQSSAIRDPPAASRQPLSAFRHPPSAIRHPPSAIRHPPSAGPGQTPTRVHPGAGVGDRPAESRAISLTPSAGWGVREIVRLRTRQCPCRGPRNPPLCGGNLAPEPAVAYPSTNA